MKQKHKPLSSLTAMDFELSHVWLAELPKFELATPIGDIANLKSDEPYLALTSYTLHDGTNLSGYCFIYDCTGHVVFDSVGRAISIWTEKMCCSLDEARTAATALDRSIEDVFPVQFQTTVKVFGNLSNGEITLCKDEASPIVLA